MTERLRSGRRICVMSRSHGDNMKTLLAIANQLDFNSSPNKNLRRVVEIPKVFQFDLTRYEQCGSDLQLDQRLNSIGFDFPYQDDFLRRETSSITADLHVIFTLYQLSFGSWMLLAIKTKENMELIMQRLLDVVACEQSDFACQFFLDAFEFVAINHRDLIENSFFQLVETISCSNQVNLAAVSAVVIYFDVVDPLTPSIAHAALHCFLTFFDPHSHLEMASRLCDAIVGKSFLSDIACLKCVCRVIAKAVHGSFSSIFSSIFEIIFDDRSHRFTFLSLPSGPVLELPDVKVTSAVAESYLGDSLSEKITLPTNPCTENVDYWHLYVPNEIRQILEILVDSNSSCVYAMDLANSMNAVLKRHSTSPSFGAFLAVFTGLCTRMIKQGNSGLLRLLLESEIFNIPVCDSDNACELVDSLRNDAIACIEYNTHVGMLAIYDLFLKRPHVLAEILKKLRANLKLILQICDDMASSTVLCNIFIYYIRIIEAYPEYETVCFAVISELVQLILNVIHHPDGRVIVFLSSAFQPVIYHLFLDAKLRCILADEVRKLFAGLPFQMVFNVKVFLSTMMEDISKKLQNEQKTNIIIDILEILSEETPQNDIPGNCSIADSFASIIDMIIIVISRLEAGEASRKVFFAAIECMTKLAIHEEFTDDMIGRLEASIVLLFGRNPEDEELLTKLLQLLKRKIENPVTSNFVVSNGKLLRLIVDIFLISRLSDKVVFFVSGILKSVANVRTCRLNEIDVLILKKVAELKKHDKKQDAELIACLLGLFQRIANTYSSARAVKQFVSLFTVIRDGVLSVHEELFLNALKSIALDEYNLGFVAKSKWRISGDADVREKGFTLFLWLRPEAESIQNLATLKCQSNEITVSMDNFAIIVTFQSGSEALTFSVLSVEEGLWNLIVLSFLVTASTTQVVPQCGLEYGQRFEIPQLQCDVIDGLITQDRRFGDIGSCGVTRLLDSVEIEKMLSDNPMREELTRREDVLSGIPNERTSFMSKLLYSWKLEVIVPIFSLWDLPSSTGEYFRCFPKGTIDLLSRILLLSAEVQDYCASQKLFGTLAGILSLKGYDESLITYSLYRSFHSLFVVLTSEALKKSMFTAILVNPRIWDVANPNDQFKIICHWRKSLFPFFEPYSYELVSFDFILDVTFVYFPYVDLGMILDHNSQNCMCDRIDDIRNELHQLLLYLASKRFRAQDFCNLFGQCTRLFDRKHAEFVVFLLNSLASEHPSALSSSGLQDHDIMALARVCECNVPEIVQNVIETIVAVRKSTHILDNESLVTYFHAILLSLADNNDPFVFDESSYSRLLHLMLLSVPELITVCGWQAVNARDDSVLVQLVKVLPDYGNKQNIDHMLIWLALSCILTKNLSLRESILKYLTGCSEWYDILSTLRVLCVLYSVEEDVCLEFIQLLHSVGVIYETEMIAQILTLFVWRLNSSDSYVSPSMKLALQDGPFEMSLFESTKLSLDARSLYEKLAKMEVQLVFGFRLTGENVWKDESLAQTLIDKCSVNTPMRDVLELLLDLFQEDVSVRTKNLDIVIQSLKKPEAMQKAFARVKNGFCRLIDVVCPKLLQSEMQSNIDSRGEFQEGIALTKLANERRWSQLWSSLTIEKCPWDSGVTHVTHWKRDETNCFGFCPGKLKRNNRFDAHQDASKARDTGETPPENKRRTVVSQNLLSNVFLRNPMDAMIVRPSGEFKAMFSIGDDKIEMVTDKKFITIGFSGVREIHKRTWNHQEIAIEIFVAAGPSYFIFFPNLKGPISKLIAKIESKCPKESSVIVYNAPFNEIMSSHPSKDAWIDGRMSNFEYLMWLNVLSGRSFCDLGQYPVFPWVLKKYNTSILDIDDESIFRDLSFPIGAVNEQRRQRLLNSYHDLEVDGSGGYFYSSGPMSPLAVCFLLVRMEPFTACHIQFQGNRFDNSDRMFTSVERMFTILNSESNEYLELPPEFFFSPEVFENMNEFDLGWSQGQRIGDVLLPTWASNALEFVYFHRKALESDYVSRTLHKWIDLIWGYLQNDKSAWNVYHPYLYETVWDDPDVEPSTIAPYLRMVGQIPPKLFREAHEPKKMTPRETPPELSLQLSVPPKCGVCLKSRTDQNIVLYFLSEEAIHTVSIKLDNEVRPLHKVTKTNAKISDIRSLNGAILGRSSGLLYYFVPDKKLYTQTLVRTDGNIVADAASDEWVATSTDDFTTSVFSIKKPHHLVGRFRSYRGCVVCSAISSTYKVHVTGTSDGILVLTSLATMEQSRVIDLEGRQPLFIEITPAWGFILVCGTRSENGRLVYYLIVYTLNGKKVNEAPLSVAGPITRYTTFASDRGFDYFAYMSKTKLVICEVFFLDQCPIPDMFMLGNIEWLEYHQGIHCFLALNDRAKLHVVPYIPDDFACLKKHMKAKMAAPIT